MLFNALKLIFLAYKLLTIVQEIPCALSASQQNGQICSSDIDQIGKILLDGGRKLQHDNKARKEGGGIKIKVLLEKNSLSSLILDRAGDIRIY